MFIIKNAVGGYFIGYQKDTENKSQPCYMFENGAEDQVIPAVVFSRSTDAELTKRALLKMQHNVYIVDISENT